MIFYQFPQGLPAYETWESLPQIDGYRPLEPKEDINPVTDYYLTNGGTMLSKLTGHSGVPMGVRHIAWKGQYWIYRPDVKRHYKPTLHAKPLPLP